MQPIINPMIQASLGSQRGPEGPLVQHALNRVNKKTRGAGSAKVSKHE
ncbi:hypothetical protein N9363_08450 [Paracoccaceae bacterium]|nr:hypothetical protein [Paracoccaceae bacterium]